MFLDSWKANKSAKLMLKSDQGDLSLSLEVNLGHYGESERRLEAGGGHQGLQRRQVGPSQLQRRARRAADPGVQQRAAEHAASAAAVTVAAAEEAAADEDAGDKAMNTEEVTIAEKAVSAEEAAAGEEATSMEAAAAAENAAPTEEVTASEEVTAPEDAAMGMARQAPAALPISPASRKCQMCVHTHGRGYEYECGLPSKGCTGQLYYWCTPCKVNRGYV